MKFIELSALSVSHPKKPDVHTWPVFEICIYSAEPRDQLREPLKAAMSAFAEATGNTYRWRRRSDMQRAESLSVAASHAMLDFLSSPQFGEPGLIGLEIFSGDNGDAYAPPVIDLFSSAILDDDAADDEPPCLVWRTYLRCCLPVTEGCADGQRLLAQAVTLFNAGRWHSGHAAYSLYWNTNDGAMERVLERQGGLFGRYPALACHDPGAFEPFIGEGLLQVGWITLLGPKLCAQLGNRPTAAEFAGTRVGVVDLGANHGVLLVAGNSPTLGSNDPALADALVPFRQVGQRVAALSLSDDLVEFLQIPGLNDEENVRRWYRRFFGE